MRTSRVLATACVLMLGLSNPQSLAATAKVVGNQQATVTFPEPQPDVVGKATDLKTGETLYLEHYYCSDDELRCSVFYLRPDDRVIARKDLDYATSPKAPDLKFQDFRIDKEIVIESTESDSVVDAGFDNFVRLQWQDLAEGDDIQFPFRMVGREEPIDMLARQRDECEGDKLCLNIRLDSWLLGNLIDPIQLTYDRDSQRLLRFKGISNLRNDEGRTQKVDIVYAYPQQQVQSEPKPAPKPANRKDSD